MSQEASMPPSTQAETGTSSDSKSSSKKYTPEQEKRYREQKAMVERAKTIMPSQMVQRLFPELECRSMAANRDSWKIYIGEDRLIINGLVFNLNWVRQGRGRYYGAGSLDLWCDLKNLDRKQHYLDAARAINDAFFHGMSVDSEEGLRMQLEARRKRQAEEKAKQEAPVPLPNESKDPKDIEAIRAYLVGKRGLSAKLVDSGLTSGALYPTREHPNAANFKSPPGETLGVVFRLLAHKDDSPIGAFAWRDINSSGQYSKINRGPKTLGAFRLGDMNGGKLVVTESGIEALSYWDFYSRRGNIEQSTVVGVSGQGDPTELIAAAKARGVKEIEAAYNGDIAGRKMNQKLIDVAKSQGLDAKMNVFYGEVNWVWRDIPEHAEHDRVLREALEKQQFPYAMQKVDRGCKCVRLPNIEPVRNLILSLEKLRKSEENIFVRKGVQSGEIKTIIQKHFSEKQLTGMWKSFPSGDRLAIIGSPAATEALNAIRQDPTIKEFTKARQVKMGHDQLADAEWLCKDWNDRLKGREQFLFRQHPAVLREWPMEQSKSINRER